MNILATTSTKTGKTYKYKDNEIGSSTIEIKRIPDNFELSKTISALFDENISYKQNKQNEINAEYNAKIAALQPQTGPVTKASELNLQKEDTVIVKEVIPEFAEKGDTLTVLKSDENSVSFTNKGKEKTLSLQELNKHTTTMDILKTEQAESTPEILDAIDKQTINETVNALTDFIGDKKAIQDAINKAASSKVTAEDLTNDLLDNLECQ
jgi:hypothetical protein